MWILGWCDHVKAFRAALKHSFTRYLFRLYTEKTKKGKCNLTCVACHKIKASGMILLKILDTLPISHALKFWQLWIPVFLLLHYQTLWLSLPHVSHDLYPEPLSDLDSALLLIFNYFCNDKHFPLLLTTQDKSYKVAGLSMCQSLMIMLHRRLDPTAGTVSAYLAKGLSISATQHVILAY